MYDVGWVYQHHQLWKNDVKNSRLCEILSAKACSFIFIKIIEYYGALSPREIPGPSLWASLLYQAKDTRSKPEMRMRYANSRNTNSVDKISMRFVKPLRLLNFEGYVHIGWGCQVVWVHKLLSFTFVRWCNFSRDVTEPYSGSDTISTSPWHLKICDHREFILLCTCQEKSGELIESERIFKKIVTGSRSTPNLKRQAEISDQSEQCTGPIDTI